MKNTYTFYIDETVDNPNHGDYIWASAIGDLTLSKVIIEADSMEEAITKLKEQNK